MFVVLLGVGLLEDDEDTGRLVGGKLAAVFGIACGVLVGGAVAALSAGCFERLLDFDSFGDSEGRSERRRFG